MCYKLPSKHEVISDKEEKKNNTEIPDTAHSTINFFT